MMEQNGLERLTGLIAFARAASLGSYTAAARSLSISPSAVSKSIQRLEERLGLKLFNRTTRSLGLTAGGQEIFDRTQRVLRDIQEIEQLVVAGQDEPAGVLKVTAPTTIGVHVLAPALPRLREKYPKLILDLRLGDRFTDLIEERIDVAIRVGDLTDSRLISHKLAPHRVCAFASPAYLARRGTPTDPSQLVDHDCVNFRYSSTGQALRWPFSAGDGVTELTPEAWITADLSDAVAAMLAAGGGIGISPTHVAATYVARGELIPVLPELAVDKFAITALWPESRRGNPNVKAFVSFLAELFPSPTPWDALIALHR